MRSFLLVLFLIVSCAITVSAQHFEWNANLHTFADNREYAKSGRFSQTIFGARFSPEVGLQLNNAHSIRAGFNALYEFGGHRFLSEIDPVLYYQYKEHNFDFYMGVFPRFGLLTDYPRAILNDTLRYFRPNTEGMLLKYENDRFRQTMWIDWTSRQTDLDRETFLFGFSGHYKAGAFFLSHHAMMFHNAGPGIPIPGDNVQDNGALSVKAGFDWSNHTMFDSLTVNVGGLMSFERTRNVTGWVVPKGMLIEFHAERFRIGITNSLYIGEGHNIMYGDRFYTAKTYNRTDLSWTPISFRNIEGRFTLSLHMLEGVVDNQQAFNLRYNIGGKKPIRNLN
ncbi:hypothetical protein [Pontibacter sp. SGAir0037]|uniref:hypothetical protein n=1 Tax=Pontibacter sp. SGAir0037 TaxID=2571030 RepID=UPI0010CD2EFC|nr:hypothetical protein [Pontibacter sp. SGAir0037]QCR24894.1 hypothetical protein C1N53_04640 [Pontibacter sp. SGAir0037]